MLTLYLEPIIGDIMENQRSFLVCKIVVFSLVLALLAGFGGCGSNKSGNAVAGAVLGGVLGGGIGALASSSCTSATASVVAGTAVGAVAGGVVGSAMTSEETPYRSGVKKTSAKK